MAHNLGTLRRYLKSVGLANVQHTHDDLLSHLVGTHEQLTQLNLPEHIVLAGLFHSIYGTEGFPLQSIPLARRNEIRDLIGEKAEQLAYRYCAMSYDSLQRSVDEGRPLLENRFENKPMALTRTEFEELLWVKLADAIEQPEEQTPQSRFFGKVAKLLGATGTTYWEELRDARGRSV